MLRVMLTALAVATSTTRTRPTTTDTPTESPQQDEYNARITAPSDHRYDHDITFNILAAASRQHNSALCPNRAPHTQFTCKSPPLARPYGKLPSQSRRKPGGDDPSPTLTTTPQQLSHIHPQPTCPEDPQGLAAEPEQRERAPHRSPQEPSPQGRRSGRHGPNQHASEPPPAIRDQCRRVKGKASPRKTGGQNNI